MIWLVAAAAASVLGWSLTDVTDNNSGVRDVHAIKISTDAISGTDFAALALDCSQGRTRLMLIWPQKLGTSYVPIEADWIGADDQIQIGEGATSWQVHPTGSDTFADAPQIFVDSLAKLSDGGLLQLQVFQTSGIVVAHFQLGGYRQMYQRVAANCQTLAKP